VENETNIIILKIKDIQKSPSSENGKLLYSICLQIEEPPNVHKKEHIKSRDDVNILDNLSQQ
jgi:hypothetical protein